VNELTLFNVNGPMKDPPPIVSRGNAYGPRPPRRTQVDVLLVSVTTDLDEIRALVTSAGHRIKDAIVQRRARPDPLTFVGKGKLDEVQERVRQGDVEIVVFNGELRPTMHYQLERHLGVECYDRLRVILELFAQRAATREAKLQVELALLQYEVPLLREWIHRADAGERPGFMAGGEYRVDAYHETVKRRIGKIRDDLERIRRDRELRRALRKDRGFGVAALTGYANAGKSSLLNALTNEHLLVEGRMFSTLSTTTRFVPGVRAKVLLTDTVGLVDGVPFWMVEAFRATLEEVFQADLVLLLIDASDPVEEVRRKVRLAARTLLPQVLEGLVVPVLTKTDLLSEDQLAMKAGLLADSEFHREPLSVSILSGAGLADLRRVLEETFSYPLEIRLVLALDDSTEAKLHWLYEHTDVLAVDRASDRVEALVRCRVRDRRAVQGLGRLTALRNLSP